MICINRSVAARGTNNSSLDCSTALFIVVSFSCVLTRVAHKKLCLETMHGPVELAAFEQDLKQSQLGALPREARGLLLNVIVMGFREYPII